MRTFLMLCLVALITGCSENKENKLNEIKQREADKIAETSNENYSELPFGLNFGMNEREVDSIIKVLINDSTITKYGDHYEYSYKIKENKEIDTWVNLGYHNGKLYHLSFDMLGDPDEETILLLDKCLTSQLDTTYNRISYYEEYKKYDGEIQRNIFTKWFKNNQIIFLRHASGSDLSYIDAPVHKLIIDNFSNKALKEAEKRLERKEKGNKIENSAWDGSVSQVKKYLQNNLKDPNSYESIEWGKVIENENGYIIRHKYRAKNSFGGYTIENNIFHLDLKGNVINVVPYE